MYLRQRDRHESEILSTGRSVCRRCLHACLNSWNWFIERHPDPLSRDNDVRSLDKVGASGQMRLIPPFMPHSDVSRVSGRNAKLAALQPLSRRYR